VSEKRKGVGVVCVRRQEYWPKRQGCRGTTLGAGATCSGREMKSQGLMRGVFAGEQPGLQVFEGVLDGFLLDESSD